MKNSYWIVILGLSCFVFLFGRAIIDKSQTFDESMLIVSGYSYWKTGDFRLDPNNPPLAKLIVSLPLLFTNLNLPLIHSSWQERDGYRFAQETLYPFDKNKPSKLGNYKTNNSIILARIPNLILVVLLGFVLWYCARKWWGDIAGLGTLGFYVFCPNILAYSSLATTDLPLAVFFFLSALSIFNTATNPSTRLRTSKWSHYVGREFILANLLKNPTLKWFILSVVSLFFALGTKSSAMIILPVSVLYLVVLYWEKRNISELKKSGLFLILVWVTVLMIIFILPPMRKSFVNSLDVRWFQIWQGQHPTFLAGQYSLTGWWYYFLVAFFVKTPIPTLMVLMFMVYGLFKRKIKLTSRELFCIIPILCFFVVGAVSKKQIGLRYILPIYPFIYLLIGQVIAKIYPFFVSPLIRGRLSGGIFLLLFLWQVIGTISISPHYLAYFNELAGGPDNGYKLLADSNLDWGQDLKNLAQYLNKQDNPEIILSYFGTVPPDFYGIKAQDLGSQPPLRANHINSEKPVKELLAVSATNLQGVYYHDHKLFDWLKKYKPVVKIGYSIFVYDITNDAWAHNRIGWCYVRNENKKLALRECRRVIDLLSDKSLGYYNLAKTYEIFGDKELAKKKIQQTKRMKQKKI